MTKSGLGMVKLTLEHLSSPPQPLSLSLLLIAANFTGGTVRYVHLNPFPLAGLATNMLNTQHGRALQFAGSFPNGSVHWASNIKQMYEILRIVVRFEGQTSQKEHFVLMMKWCCLLSKGTY